MCGIYIDRIREERKEKIYIAKNDRSYEGGKMRSISEFLGIEEGKYFYVNDNRRRHVIIGNILMEFIDNKTHQKSRYKINDLADAEIKMCMSGQLTTLESEILSDCFNENYKYIARDEMGNLSVFTCCPRKVRGVYIVNTNVKCLEIPFKKRFQMVTYENGAMEIEKLLKGADNEVCDI